MQRMIQRTTISSTLTSLFLTIFCMAGMAPRLYAQALASASITGKVTDSSGATVSGAVVKVTGPTLQVPEIDGKTDDAGNYTIVDLPAPGTYRIAFTLNGFQTYVQSDVHLSVGITGKIDAVMKIGEVGQVVEVTGENPVIDPVASTSLSVLSESEIKEVPRGLRTQELLTQTQGVGLAGPPDVGDSNFGTRYFIVTYGVVLNPTLNIEGMNTSIAKNPTTAVYVNSTGVAEASFSPVANNADVAYAGVAQEIILKSGSNKFHGLAMGEIERPSFQGNNITPALAAAPNNLTKSNPLVDNGFYDYAGNIGGYILRDRLWFFGGYSTEVVTQGYPNLFGSPGPAVTTTGWFDGTGKAAFLRSALPQYNYKVNYQASKNTQINFAYVRGDLYNSDNNPGKFRPLPNGTVLNEPGSAWHIEAQSTIGKRFLIDAIFGHAGYHVKYTPETAEQLAAFGYTKGADFAGSPSQQELSNGLLTGPANQVLDRPNNRYEMKLIGTFIPSGRHLGGTHQFKFGTVLDWEQGATAVDNDKASGDYQLNFQNGVPNTITIYNYPYPNSTNILHSQAGFFTDKWVVGHFAFNYGVRAERYFNYYPDQDKAAGQFSSIFPAQHYAGTDILTWKDIVPRAGVAWDVRGNGKTVVKASFGLFGDTMGELFAANFNPNAAQSKTYTWNGPCQNVDPLAPVQYNCDVTQAFLATLPTLTPISATGASAQMLNPNLKQNRTHEYSVRMERQIANNVSVNAAYVYHGLFNQYDAATNAGSPAMGITYINNGVDVGHPYSSWILRTTPAKAGAFTDPMTGKQVAVYSYDKTVGSTINEVVSTAGDRPNRYNTFEFGITKRYSKRWNAFAYYWITKNHRWIQGTAGRVGSPNDDPFPLDDTWNWDLRIAGTYNLPLGLKVASLLRVQSGSPGQRLLKVNDTTLAQGSTTLRVGPFGEYRGPVVPLLNVKFSRVFSFHERFKFEPEAQIFNLANSSANVTTNYLTGATTFGVVSDIMAPRVLRLGGTFTF